MTINLGVAAAALENLRSGDAAEPPLDTPHAVVVRPLRYYLDRDPASLLVEYVLEPYLVAKGLNAITAAPGVGKGKFAQALAMARAYGIPFCGLPTKAGPTLFWSGEQGEDEDARVYQAIGRGFAANLPDPPHPIFTISDPGLRLNAPVMLETVVGLCRQHPGLLVVTDSIRRAVPGEENESSVPDLFFREVFVPIRREGASMLLLGHPPKAPLQGELSLDNMIRGSGDWLAILDSMIVLKAGGRTRHDALREDIADVLIHVKARRGSKAEPATWVMHVDKDKTPEVAFTFTLSAAPEGVAKAQLAVEALALLFQERNSLTRKDAEEALKGRYSKRQIDPALRALESQGLITRLPKQRVNESQVWKWTPDSVGTGGVHASVHTDEDSGGLA